ncbi:TIGR02301 family protein [Aureimonas sp. Leaf454]|uniref:TIGR02301 family protein n=1 Tax=Aureimonas sp. Leaf454 TaxID=1736381 RepID=UPI001FCD9D28|nr:TIGR02301 family protein [Aureimonas sp. Leaf454]
MVPPLLIAVALVSGGSTWAQEPPASPDVPPAATGSAPGASKGEATGAAAPEASGVAPSDAAFMKPLGRLSSILGSIHFLRTLCGDPGAGQWRETMNELIDAQSPNEADRKILIASFNSGYRAFESTYRKCTPAARLAVSRYQSEGATLSREISARYGN